MAEPRYCSGQKRNGEPCGRRLLDLDRDALRPGKRLVVKCGGCNGMNEFVGPAPAPVAAA